MEHISLPLCIRVKFRNRSTRLLPTNVTGRQIAKLRTERSLSQDALAGKCQRAGWDISRGTLAKIEAGVRCVSDGEILLLAKALEVPVSELFPKGRRA